MAKHRKPKDPITRKAAAYGAAAVAVPTLALTFTPDAQAADTENIPRVVAPVVTPPVPPEKCADYIVKRGDSFGGIAASYGVPVAKLEALNPGVIAGDRPDDYSIIYAGGHIHLPDGSCDPTSPAAPPPAPVAHVWPVHHWKHVQHWHHHHWRPRPVVPPTPTPAPPPVTPPPVATGTTPVIAPDGPGLPSGYVPHTPTFWAPLIRQAMGLVGGGVNANQDVAGVERLMGTESSGNPNAINLYDSNASQGTPSKGLMQVIQPTFAAYHISGTSQNIYDPLANICAALNYINHVYGGSIPNSPY